MKKKLISLMIASAMLVPGAMLLGGCEHEHKYGEWETKTAATCQTAEVEVRTCECGAEETREGDAAKGHTYSAEYTYDATHHWRNGSCGHNVYTDRSTHIDSDSDDVCDVCKKGAVAKIGDKYYANLQDAVNSIEDKTKQTVIEFTATKTGGGVVVNGQNVVFEMNGYAYIVDKPPVGSAGTETLGFQLLKGSTVTFRNGTLKTAGTAVKMLVQNYCDLTLDNVTIDATSSGLDCLYALSNNHGNVTIKGATYIKADEGQRAFDLWFGLGADYDDGVNVTFDETFTGGVFGTIEYGAQDTIRVPEWQSRTKLTIKGGNFASDNGIDVLTGFAEDANIEITGGTFGFDVSAYVNTDTHQIVEINGFYVVVELVD